MLVADGRAEHVMIASSFRVPCGTLDTYLGYPMPTSGCMGQAYTLLCCVTDEVAVTHDHRRFYLLCHHPIQDSCCISDINPVRFARNVWMHRTYVFCHFLPLPIPILIFLFQFICF